MGGSLIECLLCLALSVSHQTYSEALSDFGASVSLGDPIYLTAEYSAPQHRILGQRMGKVKLPGLGVGYRALMTDNLAVSAEIAYYWPSVDPEANIEHEVVGTSLLNNHAHGIGGGLPTWWHQASQRTYNVGNGWGAGIKVDYKIAEHVHLFAGYRALKVKQYFRVCFPESPCQYPENLQWAQDLSLNLSSFSVGLQVRF